ncbi:MAG: response regulator transcription factor [Rhizobiales bacterium]|nr:response regulator transcription factor [Hyphomicrobiales bacterium]
MASQRVIVVDDHPLFREAVRQALAAAFPGISIAEAGTLDAVSEILAQDSDYDLVLLDLKMPGVQGFSGLVYLRAEYPSVPIAVVSASEEAHLMRRAIELGASGYIPKSSSAETMKRAIAAVLNGDIWLPEDAAARSGSDNEVDQLARKLTTLTPQQIRVLMMLREGLLNKQIAYQLKVSEATVKAHVSAILQKLEVDSRTQAVIAASRIDGEAVPNAS